MTSMRKLRRRLLRWQRYAAAIGVHPIWGSPDMPRPAGHYRAAEAAAELAYRREVAAERGQS